MSLPGPTINPYDEIPFPSQPVSASNPDVLAAVARLFGMQPAPVEKCRVLELGCATGGNLLPMADRYPDSQFVGIDYSRAQLDNAERMIAQAGLTNVELKHADIAKLDGSLGKFDYIICHGVYSWVPCELDEKILAYCRDSLTPQGVAYVSYNVKPGWFLKGMLREMLFEFAPPSGSARQQLDKSKALLDFFAQAGSRLPGPYAKLIKDEAEGVAKLPDGYVYHEYFESENRPLYLHEFVSQIEQFDLQYLGESAVATMFVSNFSGELQNHIKNLSFDLVGGEQHLDYIRNRAFRQSLICHREASLERHLTPELLEGLRFHGRIRPQNQEIELNSQASELFHSPTGVSLTTSAPDLKATLLYLSQQWPSSFTFDELLSTTNQLLGRSDLSPEASAQARETLGRHLIKCLAGGILEISTTPDHFVKSVSERPCVTLRTRIEARAMEKITNRRHALVDIDEGTRNILPYLDGRHDRAALLNELQQAVARGDVSILVDGIPATNAEAALPILTEMLDRSLAKLAAAAVLIA